MKKIFLVIIALLLFSGASFAQRGLNCFPIFEGKVVPAKQMVLTEVRGGGMATYKLDYYRGITFTVDSALAEKVSALVGQDAVDAESCETEKVGDLLTYALIQPKVSGRIRHYLCYQAKPAGSQWRITILYLEGPATLEDLRSMFEKQ
ncbi:MAG: hypothetical protein IKX60_08645 [Bacteroidales bacterium]|nr:hypothetical protein [Bacteroidales bacterium]